jgi:hypothetical protein
MVNDIEKQEQPPKKQISVENLFSGEAAEPVDFRYVFEKVTDQRRPLQSQILASFDVSLPENEDLAPAVALFGGVTKKQFLDILPVIKHLLNKGVIIAPVVSGFHAEFDEPSMHPLFLLTANDLSVFSFNAEAVDQYVNFLSVDALEAVKAMVLHERAMAMHEREMAAPSRQKTPLPKGTKLDYSQVVKAGTKSVAVSLLSPLQIRATMSAGDYNTLHSEWVTMRTACVSLQLRMGIVLSKSDHDFARSNELLYLRPTGPGGNLVTSTSQTQTSKPVNSRKVNRARS